MANIRITREQIWGAADELDRAGQNPTLAAVRKAVGGGSYTTIQDVMTAWKAKKAAPHSEPAPAALGERMQALLGEVWSSAVELATAHLEIEREALEKARVEIDEARMEAADLADQLTAELDQARAQIEQMQLAASEEQRFAAGLREQLAVAQSKGEELARQIDAEQRAAADARRTAAEAREEAASLRGQVEVLKEQHGSLLQQLARTESKKLPKDRS